MDIKKTDAYREFLRLYQKADYKTRREIELKLHRAVARNTSKKQLETSLFEAVEQGNLKAVSRMVESDSKLDINCTDELGNTTLIRAILKKNPIMVELLITKGANPNIQNKKGRNSFDAAEHIKNSDISKLLQRYIN